MDNLKTGFDYRPATEYDIIFSSGIAHKHCMDTLIAQKVKKGCESPIYAYRLQ
ncbi:MAG: hypothetical protein NC318_07405 [Blautia sp.]|nr:hypothetical protein [Lachnoclostridium sp.]MCM1211414.1 hypothetical protein [Blautia sp.]